MRLRSIATGAVIVGLLGAPTLALAQESTSTGSTAEAAEPGFSLGVRPAFALPLGRTSRGTDGVALGDVVVGTIPIWVDAGYRVSRNVYVGLFGQVGIGLGRNCGDGMTCSATSYRFGPNVQFRLRPQASLDPWFGVGAGYELLALSTAAGKNAIHSVAHGFEVANVQAGVDWVPVRSAVKAASRIGPFVAYSTAIYSRESFDGRASGDDSIAQTTLHGWLYFGLKGMVDL